MQTPSLNTLPLKELGLTENEIRVFVALQHLGTARAGELMQQTGLQNSVMHLTLSRLSQEGFITHARKGKMRVYQAIAPRRLLELQANRTTRLESFVSSLEEHFPRRDFPEAEVYQGPNGLKSMCYRLIEDAEPGDEFLFFAFHTPNEDFQRQVYGFYREYTDVRIERGLKLRGLAHESTRKSFLEHRWPHSNIRFVDQPIIHSTSVCGDKVILVPWLDSQVSFLIRSQSFANNLREYFQSLWEASKSMKAPRTKRRALKQHSSSDS